MGNIFGRLRELITPYNNIERAAYMLCQKFNVPATMANIQKELKNPPDYPSVLAISGQTYFLWYKISNAFLRNDRIGKYLPGFFFKAFERTVFAAEMPEQQGFCRRL